MPRFNARGDLVIGLGRDPYDDTRSIAQECNTLKPGCCLALSDGTIVREGGLVALHAADRVWAIMPHPEGGYLDSFGRRFAESAPGPVSPDGAIAIKVVYHSFGPWDVIEADGSRWRLTNGDANDIQLLGARRAIWREGGTGYRLHAKGLTIEQPDGEWGWPRIVTVKGLDVLLYQSYTGKALVFDGYVVAEGTAFHRPDGIVVEDVVRLAWSTQPQEYGVTVEIAIPLSQLGFLPRIADRLKAAPPPPPPPSDPEPQPEPSPMPETPNYIELVRLIDGKFPHLLLTNTIATCGEFTERCAEVIHEADPEFGLLSKSGAEKQWNGHGIDSLIHKRNQQVIDIIGGAAAETVNGTTPKGTPSWQEVSKRDSNNWMAPLPVGDVPDDPPTPDEPKPDEPKPPPPPGDIIAAILKRIAALEGPRTVAIKSSRDRYQRDDWSDNTAKFDRTSVGSGELFTIEPLESVKK